MSQNIYDDPSFFDKYKEFDRQKLGLDGAPEWHSVKSQLPELNGKRVLDLGCGFGWFCRFAQAEGAKSVHGIDISETMIQKARTFENDDSITYEVADLETIEFEPLSYDFAHSSLTFHYIADFERLMKTLFGALTPNSDFVFTIEHPLYIAVANRKPIEDVDGSTLWTFNQYSVEGKKHIRWLGHDVVKYSRTIGTTVNMLMEVGFTIQHVEEWKPSDQQINKNPEWIKELDRPTFLLVAAHKP